MVTKRAVFTIVALLVASVVNATETPVSGNVSGTWNLAGSPYIVTGNVTIQAGNTLTIEPGVDVKFNSQKRMTVDGTIDAEGTSGSRITFTSNQSPPAAGDWGRIIFSSNNTGCVLAYVTVEYADTAIDLTTGSPSIQHSEIRNNNYGIYLHKLSSSYPTPTIAYSSFHNNSASNIYATCPPYSDLSSITIDARFNWWGTADPIEIGYTIHDWRTRNVLGKPPLVDYGHFLDGPSGNPVPENYVRGALHANTSWLVEDSPYIVIGDILIYSGSTLSIKPGVTVKFLNDPLPPPTQYFSILVNGALRTQGKVDSVITFTSARTPSSPGDWEKIKFEATSVDTSCIIDYAVVEYARTGVNIEDASPTVTHSRLRYGDNENAYGSAIHCTGSSQPIITHNDIHGNHIPIYFSGSAANYPNPQFTYNSILDNTTWDVYAQSCTGCESITVNAEDNWWGTTDSSAIAARISATTPAVDFTPPLPASPMSITEVPESPLFIRPTASEQAEITYTLDRGAYVTVNIYSWDFEVPDLGATTDITRTHVATPVKGVFKSAGSDTAVWNGRDDAGALLPFQAYGYTIEANAAGTPGELGSYDPPYNKEFPVDFSDSTVTGEFNPYDNDRCEIAYCLGPEPPDTVAAWVTVTVFDMGADPHEECRAFLQMIPRRPRNHVEYWEGRDNEGHLVGSLTYRVRGFAQGLPVNTVVTEPPAMSVTVVTCRPYVFRPLFNEVTAIKYTISATARVTLRIFDPADQFVVTLVDEEQSAGEHTLQWDGTDLDGAYVRDSGDYRIEVSLSDDNGGTVSWNGNVLVYR
jgi:flagellar hook assembly protein FlgD